ncbi:MAG: hypothetical protein KKE73_03275 [Proteobacteria bacterium]|nr:hypothetical protein [Pseudomonadota bacterium]
MLKRFLILTCLLALLVSTFGCEKEGEMEKAGKKLDQAAESLKDSSKKLFE